ncbi:hypothetical protein KVR01_012909 [Diaporthe batatas]|uniref:uncharacterized protein n=1 Tax=Diaporthe batatas TaxID=748121 RepID=UPI001D0388ED|nr:uncharacterized protein KVR01_012909 [Diaporthe batatas]KAG8157201.1 hypothetical protein KVR01_012909 [Diaporthe batatas]
MVPRGGHVKDPRPAKNTKTLVLTPAEQVLVKPDSKHHQQLVHRTVEKAQTKPSSKMQANPGSALTQESASVDRGDFVGSDEEDEVEDESEDSLQYLYGLYYPVRIGDLFHRDRYQIIHKLGRGGFSTVWLAHDRRDGKDVALKILSSSENAAKEYKIHEAIRQRVQGRSRLVLFQDYFTLTWVDRSKTERKHHVLVLPLHGPSLLTLLNTRNKPLSERMSAAKQILQAIATIHSAGLVHRDIVLGNVVCGLKVDLGKKSVNEKYQLLGRPRKAKALWEEDPETGKDVILGELVAPATFPPALVGADAYLCDFGILVPAGTSVRNKLQSQPVYCAPELFHNIEPSFASDVWSYMVLFLYLYTENSVFAIGPGFAGVLNSIVDGVGLLPKEWKGRYEAYDKAKAKEAWYGRGSPAKSMFSAFLDMHRPDITAAEKALVHSIIQQVFRPRPGDRVTAVGLMDNTDFKALMSIYGVH